MCKEYEVGGGEYDGLICGIFSQSKVRYIEWAVSGPYHYFLVARRLPRLIILYTFRFGLIKGEKGR